MNEQQGEVWAVPAMPPERWLDQSHAVWYRVQRDLEQGWSGKLADGFRLAHGRPKEGFEGWGLDALVKANELGAPVGQFFAVHAIRDREQPS